MSVAFKCDYCQRLFDGSPVFVVQFKHPEAGWVSRECCSTECASEAQKERDPDEGEKGLHG